MHRLRQSVLALGLALGLAATAGPGSPPVRAAEAVDLELVLAVDVSGSVDPVEARLQRKGYADAFRDPRVIRAIAGGALGRIAVVYVEWAGVDFQGVAIDWTVIADAASAGAFADRIAQLAPRTWRWTSLSGAIDFSVPLFARNAYEAERKVIDISGDGRNNSGRPAAEARDDAVAQGIVINGLPIMNDRENFGSPPDPNLDVWYEANVIGGPGSFLVVAENFGTFSEAIVRKLLLEIALDPATRSDGTPSEEDQR